MSFTVTSRGISLPELPDAVLSVDICFDEQRIWSIDLRDAPSKPGVLIPWPGALTKHLHGETEVALRNSANSGTEKALARFTIRFTDDQERTRVVDDSGAPLALNKWGRLGKTLGGSDLHDRILEQTTKLITTLQGLGLRPFVVGGTLLGGVRDSQLLPHDDDADIAYLSEHTLPLDVAVEAFKIGHQLESLGYELVRHSATHMQLQFRSEGDDDVPGRINYYIDVFAAFFTDDGHINQPFHVRGAMRQDQMLPFSAVAIAGREYPAPADPESWLVINYDEHWRTPLPGFQLNTPRSTVRRFENWFGSFNLGRDYWNDFAKSRQVTQGLDRRWRSGADWILAQNDHLRAPTLLELGAGSGELSAALKRAKPGRRVIAVDYSPDARDAAKILAEREGIELAHSNLRRLLAIGLPGQREIDGAFDLVTNHLYEQLGPDGHEPTLRLARMALRSGGQAFMTLFTRPSKQNNDDPANWHTSLSSLASEAKHYGLGTEFFALGLEIAEENRKPYGVRFSLTDTQPPPKEFEMKSFLKRVLMRGVPGTTRADVDELTVRVADLEAEIDELRRDRLRLAELLDLAERRLNS